MADTPSQEIINSAKQTVLINDVNGRQIEVRKLRTLDRMRLFELVGPENSPNQQYLGYATLAYSVSSIDGVPVPRPTTKLALEGIVQRLDEHGFNAVAKAISENFLPVEQNTDAENDAIKNG